MSIDLTKLTPAPWYVTTNDYGTEFTVCAKLNGQVARIVSWHSDIDAEFIALARNAFDIMMWHGWHAVPLRFTDDGCDQWGVKSADAMVETIAESGFSKKSCTFWPDPFTALVEADAWYRANIEKASQQ